MKTENDELRDRAIETYKGILKQYTDVRDARVKLGKPVNEFDAEIGRLIQHIDRLEKNHAECIESCCPGCTCGGLK